MDRGTLLESPPSVDEHMARARHGAAPKLSTIGWLDELSAKSLEVACILFEFYVPSRECLGMKPPRVTLQAVSGRFDAKKNFRVAARGRTVDDSERTFF